MAISIRRATDQDSVALTRLSFASKRYWKYPDAFFDVWKDELTITRDYIAANRVYVAIEDGQIIGYFSIVEVRRSFFAGDVFVHQGFWLEHLYITPDRIRTGIGSLLIQYAEDLCREEGIDGLFLFADPHARGFYERLGAEYLGESPSNIKDRTVSLFRLPLRTRGGGTTQ